MRKNIFKAPCLFLSLFTSLNLCSGKFGTLITDDVIKLSLLKQNIPWDYEIPVHFIPKEVAGSCWVLLNIYPLEQSLGKLANMFGSISSNKENIIVFIAMLKSLRFTLDHQELETAMQVFQCHYREGSLMSASYFDFIKEVLQTAAQETSGFACKPPPCLDPQHMPGGQGEAGSSGWSRRAPLLLAVIPLTAIVLLLLRTVKCGGRWAACSSENRQVAVSDSIPTVSISIPLQRLSHAADAEPEQENVSRHESG